MRRNWRQSGDSTSHAVTCLASNTRFHHLGLTVVTWMVVSGAFGQCYYKATPIPNAPGNWNCWGQAINGQGWVAGTAFNGGENTRAFLWTAEVGTRLLPLPPGAISFGAYGINDVGHVAGAAETLAGYYGFLWDGT